MKKNYTNNEANLSGIYIIHNTVDYRFYLGSATCIRKRFCCHLYQLKKGTHHSKHMLRFVDKHGIDKLIFSPIIFCNISELEEKEQVLLSVFKPKFNNTFNVSKPQLGVKFSEERKNRIAEMATGRKHSEETKKKIGDWSRGKPGKPRGVPAHNRGIPHTQEARLKMTLIRIGKKASDETKKKMSLNRISGNNPNSKLILNIQTGIFYDSGKDAADSINMNYGTFKPKLNGRRKNTTDFVFV